ncbi:MAG: DNA starvation/stationary phase protection protein [Streptosporangiales bacterium]|nr:DNA starvation/stationary phase protection protein [Streptosporangiales bacterium]
MATVKSPLSTEARNKVGKALQASLVELIDLSLVAKQAHWNLTGRNFRSLHLQLDEIVAMARQHMDTVAERAVAVGVNPDGRAATVADHRVAPQMEAGYLQDDKVVATFVDVFHGLVERFRARHDTVSTADAVTENIFAEILHDLEKTYWMLQAEQ